MKFYAHHRKDILKSFEVYGFTKADFSFIKRKGRIVTQFDKYKSTFSFIQREESLVDDNTREWIDIIFFEVKIHNAKAFRVEKWETVLLHLNDWLKSIS